MNLFKRVLVLVNGLIPVIPSKALYAFEDDECRKIIVLCKIKGVLGFKFCKTIA